MKTLQSDKKYECGLFSVTEDRVVDPQGHEIKRSVVRHAGSAVVLVVDAQQRVLLVKQFRLPAEDYLWELPAGRLDPGENPREAAERELIEETGYRAKQWSELVTFYASPGFLAEKMTIFLAEDLTAGESSPMDDERIEMEWFSGEQIDEMLCSGRIVDGKTMIGYLTWKRFQQR